MPIQIYKDNYTQYTSLCENDWELPIQIDILEQWLIKEGIKLTKGDYIADIGFHIRKEASGGGAALSSRAMKVMGEIGMNLHLSEYHSE